MFIPDYLQSKFDKKIIHCIFVKYCCDPTIEKCYVSRNIMFDEVLSLWSTQTTLLPDSRDIEEKLQ